MIDEKKIKQAAIECADEYYSLDFGKDREETNREIFVRGVHWAINEFLKDLWHEASEEPRKNNIYLAQIGDCAFDTFYDSKNWDTYSKGVNITRWLYIDDLLPKKGGEK